MRKDVSEPDQLTGTTDELGNRLDELIDAIERTRLGEYFDLLERPHRMLLLNFLAGLARGVGMAIGFAFLSAVIVYTLTRLVKLDLPLIGGFIANIVRIVHAQLGY